MDAEILYPRGHHNYVDAHVDSLIVSESLHITQYA